VKIALEHLLSSPDRAEEHIKPHWNRKVATALRHAYAFIEMGDLSAAAVSVRPYLGHTMGTIQRLRVLFVLSLEAAESNRLKESFDFVEEALDISVDMNDLDSCATLAYHGASVLHNMQQFVDAAKYYDIALDALRSSENWDPETEAPREFDLLVSLAIEEFSRARFPEANEFLSAAARLPLVSADHQLRVARAEWTASLLARWQGDDPLALQRALASYTTYVNFGTPIERARMSLALADVYLDFASPPGKVPSSAEYGRIADLSERPIMEALVSTRASGDSAGEGLALLTYARYLRISRRDEDVLGIIAMVEHLSCRLQDLPLLGQAYTARGTELMSRGQHSQALVSFRAALEVLNASQVLAQAIWPQRALREDEEMRER
jgi:tetratricopeptide (TPR) repeat protein